MASSVEKEGSAAVRADAGASEEPVWLDLPAPSGWSKKISEFDWGNGEAPRRSARIIDKAKAAPVVEHESEPPKKRGKKSAADLKASNRKIDDKGAEGSKVVQTKDEEKIGKPAKEMKKRWWKRDWKIGQCSE